MQNTITGRSKPAPTISAYNEPYWEYARRHELRLQRCQACRQFWAPPGPVCPHCFAGDFTWEEVSGRGEISSWVRFHKAYHPAFETAIPFNVAFVELVEGPRLITNVVDAASRELRTGTPVRVVFEDCGKFTLPQFAPIEDGGEG